MEPSAITTIIVGVLTALVPAIYTYLSGENRRSRAENRLFRAQRDARDERDIKYRAAIRLHNDKYHPFSENCAPLPDLPDHMRGADEDAAAH